MFFDYAELRPFIGKYTQYIVNGIGEMSFKKCAILLDSASDNNALVLLLRELGDCEKHWLLYFCFYIACYRQTERNIFKHTIKPNWRTNVAVLGEMVDFNVETVLAVLSFIDPEEHCCLFGEY